MSLAKTFSRENELNTLKTTQNHWKILLAILHKGSSESYLKISWCDVCKNDLWLVTKVRK